MKTGLKEGVGVRQTDGGPNAVLVEQNTLFDEPQTTFTSDDYYTPKWIFDALDLRFDLDVAAPPGGIWWIPANSHYTMLENGLASAWTGRVWMNPPFSRPEPWVYKFLAHGNGMALLPVSKSRWFYKMWQTVDGITSMPPNLKFETADGQTNGVFIATVIVAMGKDNAKALTRIGRVR